MKFTFITLILLFNIQTVFSQELDINGNWYKEIKGIDDNYTGYDFKRYTVSDVINAKKKYQIINRSLPAGEWEGAYISNLELGWNELHWNENEFVFYAVYHMLFALDFGNSKINSYSVKLSSCKSSPSKIFSNELVKIKIGEKHYLVPENRLKDFAERAVGVSVNLFSDSSYYWSKINESEMEDVGLPVFPPKYSHYLRSPIETKIVGIGNRQVHQNKFDDGTVNYEEVYRFVTLGAGKNKKIKKGMNFFVKDLGEWVEVTKVLSSSSLGKIRRSFYEKKEACLNDVGGSGQIIPCKEIKTEMEAKTKISPNYF